MCERAKASDAAESLDVVVQSVLCWVSEGEEYGGEVWAAGI